MNLVFRLKFSLHYLAHPQGSVFGNAAGVKLSSLSQLTEVKGHNGGHHLLEHLVRVAEAQSDDVLMFVNDMPQLTKAAR